MYKVLIGSNTVSADVGKEYPRLNYCCFERQFPEKLKSNFKDKHTASYTGSFLDSQTSYIHGTISEARFIHKYTTAWTYRDLAMRQDKPTANIISERIKWQSLLGFIKFFTNN